ncbi:hypothetical protein MBLNU457_3591t1 [Dothideomycetes sp. NU457]
MANDQTFRKTIPYAVHQREIQSSGPQKIRSLYGNTQWIKDLDIINELEGHSGCVNALSWSENGRLLASGSDDQHINIHTYNPVDAESQFSLTTTVATGHTDNIFSVKFMPHSNDRTVITASGDSEIRIFDLEYAGATRDPSQASSMARHGRRRGRHSMFDGVRYLSDGDTDCKVYQSHADRVKRIVTECSPHLFLTCSEDGEVRQWDLRQPSSAYPPPNNSRRSNGLDNSVPPPLISYKRYNLDLNTISCSPSQPHYIALGGAHLHCFVHDRRMLGRDVIHERGGAPSTRGMSSLDEERLGQATQCVKKFAPNGQQRMRRTDNGHITACKISDANPNELIASWSGENVYSFDMLRAPDAREAAGMSSSPIKSGTGDRVRESQDRKRKRKARGGSATSLSFHGAERAGSRQRTDESGSEDGDVALRVQYQNGQSEDIRIIEHSESDDPIAQARQTVMPPRLRAADILAKRMVKLRQHLFTLDAAREQTDTDPTGYAHAFTSVLGFCASTLPELKGIHTTWRYPVDPSTAGLAVQRTLRANRESAMRFVQAAGVIARALGGQIRSASESHPAIGLFQRVGPSVIEGPDIQRGEQFAYDFLKAIFLWLESGVGSLLDGFTKQAEYTRANARRPVPQDSGAEAVNEYLVPYLLSLASDRPIYNVDASRFEVDENRVVFRSEKDAVLAFAAAVNAGFADLSSMTAENVASQEGEGAQAQPQDRKEAMRRWGFTVARGVLMNAAEGVNYAFVSRAFGGLGQADARTRREEAMQTERQEDIDPGIEEPVARSVEVVNRAASEETSSPATDAEDAGDELVPISEVAAVIEEMAGNEESDEEENEDGDGDGDEVAFSIGLGDLQGEHDDNEIDDDNDEDDEDHDDHEDDEDDDDEEEDDEDEDEEDDAAAFGLPQRVFRSAYDKRRFLPRVEADVPCVPHTRVYRGHCNIKTVKDVNFFGLDDEYVISGSDDGNFFVWDRKTSSLVNILQGDGEVVNVLQGHPYETMLAVSGIDHTIKIFSPDARAREAARLGRGIHAADSSDFSSIQWPLRLGGRRVPSARSRNPVSEPAVPAPIDEHDDEYVAPNGLASRKRMHDEYQITSQNDISRQGGNQEAYITRSMLAQLAANVRRRRAEGGGGEHGEEGAAGGVAGGRIVISDDCTVM